MECPATGGIARVVFELDLLWFVCFGRVVMDVIVTAGERRIFLRVCCTSLLYESVVRVCCTSLLYESVVRDCCTRLLYESVVGFDFVSDAACLETLPREGIGK
jgi:hypothetical protein